MWILYFIERVCLEKQAWSGFHIIKGGEFKKWYGNNEYVVNWENDGLEIRSFKDNKGKLDPRPQNLDYYFQQGITWSLISSNCFGWKYIYRIYFDITGDEASCWRWEKNYILGFMACKVAFEFLKIINSSMAFQIGDIKKLPIIFNELKSEDIGRLVEQNIEISKTDWDSYETSWEFKRHPLLRFDSLNLNNVFNAWQEECAKRFYQLKSNEEKVKWYFHWYIWLKKELIPDVEEKMLLFEKHIY